MNRTYLSDVKDHVALINNLIVIDKSRVLVNHVSGDYTTSVNNIKVTDK